MQKRLLSSALLAALLPLVACNAQPTVKNASEPAAAAPADAVKTITDQLAKSYGDQDLKVLSVTASPVAGVYEVHLSGNQLVYMSADGKHMFTGDLIDVTQRSNLSEERRSDLNRIDYSALPLDKAITEVRGNGQLKVVVFTDADCPYCKRLEREFEKMTDVTIYNFMMPIPSLHPAAQAKSERIWCSSDRTAAWTGWMRQGVVPPEVAPCPNPVAETMELGNQYGFNGTPTLVFPNGKIVAGFIPNPQLQQTIADNQK